MRTKLKVPRYGTNMSEATVLSWLVEVGDEVSTGDGLCELETEKVNTVYESPTDGVVIELCVDPGAVVEVGEALCILQTSA